MPDDLQRAREYVKGLDLSGTPRGLMEQSADTSTVFDGSREQAQIVGSGVFSFAQGVTAEVREAISDSALLAQLVANKRVDAEKDPLAWFGEYFTVLSNVGWTAQELQFTDYSSSGTAAEVHEKIIEVMAAVLAPAPAALAIITASVNALRAMEPDSPWLTLFSRESQKARLARFQVGLVEREEGSDVFVGLLASLVEAKNTITQVLLFKFKQEKASFRANVGKISINRQSLLDLGPVIRTKTRAYQMDYVSALLDL